MPTRMALSRRGFLASMAAAVPIAFVVRRAHAAARRQLASNPATLAALAEAVLPSELGRVRLANEVAAFRAWGDEYQENAELVHGYGTSRLRATGPTPLTRWTRQLDELDADARRAHRRAFHELTAAQRAELVRTALEGARVDRMPGIGNASHVALALLAHFYTSPSATDLCYNAQIGNRTCRPLVAQASKPLPVVKLHDR